MLPSSKKQESRIVKNILNEKGDLLYKNLQSLPFPVLRFYGRKKIKRNAKSNYGCMDAIPENDFSSVVKENCGFLTVGTEKIADLY